MASSSAYYSNEEATIQRETDVHVADLVATPAEKLNEIYEIERCVKYIKEKKCKKVSLQFPDSLLVDASNVAKQLENNCDAKIYILADTSYGHCDIDEVNAKHITSDLLIHYGETSLTPSATIPTLFVFGRHPSLIDADKVCEIFRETYPSKCDTRVVFLHHVSCDYIADSIASRLVPEYPYLSVGELNIPKDPGGAKGLQAGEEEENILKDLCTKSCPGCPCRLENTDKNKKGDLTRPTELQGSKLSENVIKILVHPEQTKNDSNLTRINNIDGITNSSTASKEGEDVSYEASETTEYPTNISNGNNSASKEDGDTHHPDCKDYVTGFYTIPLEFDKKLSDYSIFYLGSKNAESLRNFMLTHPTCNVHVFDPETGIERMQSNTNRQLMKRYYLVEKVKDAKIVGILCGTMGVAGYLECMNYMKKIGKAAGKKIYTFIMGKLTPEKLANFLEIDIYVLVANPEHNNIDVSNFYRPVVTPYEFEVACNPSREWSENYVTDFRTILPGGTNFVEFPENYSKDDETTMSLISGNIRTNNNSDIENCTENADALAIRNDKTSVAVFGPNSSAQKLSERSWKGLEQKLGETPVTKATKGRSGLPVSYNEMIDF
ncbi:2-(3-amino-3-carboxypropyl)histidine synthase subunit 2-like [Styela clava]